MAYCKYHSDRHGIGICMRCRNVICPECVTRLDGINHCHGCLEEIAVRPVPVSQAPRFGQATVLFLAWLGLLWVLWLAKGSLAP